MEECGRIPMARISFAGDSGIRVRCGVGAVACPRRRAAGGRARAAPTAATPADVARLQGDIDRLKQELAAQRQLILQLMQAEQQRYDVVLKYLQTGGTPPGDPAALLAPPLTPPSPTSAGKTDKDSAGAPGARESATVTGKVRTASGQPVGEAYVYVGRHALRRARPHRRRSASATSSSRHASRSFPSAPSCCFRTRTPSSTTCSRRPPATRSIWDRSRAARRRRRWSCSSPARWRSSATSTRRCAPTSWSSPNSHWTRVAADGSFQLTGIPVGTRKIVLWSPMLKPTSQQVEVTAKGGTVSFTSEAVSLRPHMNKRGQAYGSYDE